MSLKIPSEVPCFRTFREAVDSFSLPERFTFPFYYKAHPLCVLAAKELQDFLEKQREWEHDFGIDKITEGISLGKMFGVLLVQKTDGQLGYLAAFSGKLAGTTELPGFVPPVYDRLRSEGFFVAEEQELNGMNLLIDGLEANPELLDLKRKLENETENAASDLQELKAQMRLAKQVRKSKRQKMLTETDSGLKDSLTELDQESIREHFELKDRTKYWKKTLSGLEEKLACFNDEISVLKEERRNKSAALQQKLFQQYDFLNQYGERKSLFEIFKDTEQLNPSSGAGECAAPKLLQYAFLHDLKPLALAEFWWGAAPASEIRKHGNFYPACRGKCEPILAHMLEGIETDENPLLADQAEGKKIEIIFEDEYLLAVNKPPDLLSVPGKSRLDSVYERIRCTYPEATGPLLVHRLDMSTSGIMLIAKTAGIHKLLQSQFIGRTVQKRYLALLDGIVDGDEGFIELPLRVDLDDRPRQLVCFEHGKSARTKWKVLEHLNGQTRIHFFPITGRTHQLRVHAAHQLGLNLPILGDDLYGTKADRLYLHAETITFIHPVSNKRMTLKCGAGF